VLYVIEYASTYELSSYQYVRKRFEGFFCLCFLLEFKKDLKQAENGQLKMSFTKPRLNYKRPKYFKFE